VQFLQSAEAGQSSGIPHQFSQAPVIGMLIFHRSWGKHFGRTNPADNFCQPNRVNGSKLQMSITVKLDEFNRRAQQSSGFFGFSDPLFRGTVSASFTARTNDEVHFASGMRFARDHATAAEFDVVGMRTKG
jgi:hypothetical protein